MDRPLKINVIGGGPGGLYFSLLMKLQDPRHDISVYERNRPDDTFGFGVVFSDETLGNFMGQDPETYLRIRDAFAYWDEIEVRYKGERIRSGGHGFAGMSRQKLLDILQERCLEAGVKFYFENEISDLDPYLDADLLLGSDGVNSTVREAYKGVFKPTIDMRKTKFVWLGTTQKFDAFTFIFKPNKHGWFYNHAYQYGQGEGLAASTWILETHEDTWSRAGLDQANEDETIEYFEENVGFLLSDFCLRDEGVELPKGFDRLRVPAQRRAYFDPLIYRPGFMQQLRVFEPASRRLDELRFPALSRHDIALLER